MAIVEYIPSASASPKAPFSFTRMRFSRSCSIRVLSDPESNAVFEILHNGSPIMAFRYEGISEADIGKYRERFALMLATPYSTLRDMGLDMNLRSNLRYLSDHVRVPRIPDYEMWDIGSELGETAFWVTGDALLCVYPFGQNGSAVDLNLRTGMNLAYFRIPDRESDDELVLDGALELRKKLHIRNQIRVESRYSGKRVCWYIPSLLRQSDRAS